MTLQNQELSDLTTIKVSRNVAQFLKTVQSKKWIDEKKSPTYAELMDEIFEKHGIYGEAA